jgi:hypothetical protein
VGIVADMSPLFGKNEEKAAHEGAAQAEAARLEALSVPDLAEGTVERHIQGVPSA